jgi:hypothetical protein
MGGGRFGFTGVPLLGSPVTKCQRETLESGAFEVLMASPCELRSRALCVPVGTQGWTGRSAAFRRVVGTRLPPEKVTMCPVVAGMPGGRDWALRWAAG